MSSKEKMLNNVLDIALKEHQELGLCTGSSMTDEFNTGSLSNDPTSTVCSGRTVVKLDTITDESQLNEAINNNINDLTYNWITAAKSYKKVEKLDKILMEGLLKYITASFPLF